MVDIDSVVTGLEKAKQQKSDFVGLMDSFDCLHFESAHK